MMNNKQRLALILDSNADIFVMDADGDNVRQVTQLEFAVAPKWSPDGERIAFEGIIDQRRQVYVISTDGTNRQLVSQPIPDAGMFLGGWSPDGTQILYKASIHDSVKNSTVIITTLKTNKHEPVPIPKMDSTSVDWSGDGKSILIALRKEGGNWDIYRFRLRDRQLIQLTDHPAKDSSPHEWNSRLPVSPKGPVPKRWGEIKSTCTITEEMGGGQSLPFLNLLEKPISDCGITSFFTQYDTALLCSQRVFIRLSRYYRSSV